MGGAMPPLPQYAFIAWCSVKAQGQLYFYQNTVLVEGANVPADGDMKGKVTLFSFCLSVLVLLTD
jgi:hypothetical protein